MTGNIFICSNKGWLKIGTIDPITINQNIPNIETVKMSTLKILGIIQNYHSDRIMQLAKNAKQEEVTVYGLIDPSEKLKLKLLDIMKYRRCTIFVFEQINCKTGLKRILAYGDDIVMHSGVSFGTSLDLVNPMKIRKCLEKIKDDFSGHVFFV